MYSQLFGHIREYYGVPEDFIPLHVPHFIGNEKDHVSQTIDSTFVSSVGAFVNQAEEKIAQFTGAKFAIATSNGTSALHVSLLLAGVKSGDEVITQPLTFIATANAIHYARANPVFVDVSENTMGLCSIKLEEFLTENTRIDDDGNCINTNTGKRISACVPMHTFGFATDIAQIAEVCKKFNISLVEDAAESLGTTVGGKSTGTFGSLGAFSFNGNKIITSGGGGMIVTDDESLAIHAKHLTTTAKLDHPWEYIHDEIGFNYRMPNINAALLVAQIENLPLFLENKRKTAQFYRNLADEIGFELMWQGEGTHANFWLNTVRLKNKEQRDRFLEESHQNGIGCRPIWQLMHHTPMYKNCERGDLSISEILVNQIVNLPSSYNPKA